MTSGREGLRTFLVRALVLVLFGIVLVSIAIDACAHFGGVQ